MPSSLSSHHGTRFERSQIEPVHVELATRFRVVCQQDLKPSVEEVAVHSVGPHSPAHTVGCFQQDACQPRLGHDSGAGQTETGTHHHHIYALSHRSTRRVSQIGRAVRVSR